MMRALTASVLAAVLAGAAQADLRDVQALSHNGVPQIWLAFDHQPQSVTLGEGGGLVLHVSGVEADQVRRFEAAVSGPVGLIELTPEPGGARIVLTGAFVGGTAELREGGVLVTLSDVSGASAPIQTLAEAQREGGAEPASRLLTPSSADGGAPGTLSLSATPTSTPVQAADSGDSSGAGASAEVDTPDAAAAEAPGSEPYTPRERLMGQSRSPADDGAEPERAALPDPMRLEQAAADEDTPPGLCPQTASRLADAPWDLSLLASHADCLAAAGETTNAIGLYERVLAFEPRHFQAAIGLARLRAETGDHAAAAMLYETAAGSARTDGQAVQARISARQARERAEASDN